MPLETLDISQVQKSLTRDDSFTDKFRTGNVALTGRVFYKVAMPNALWFIAQVIDALNAMTKEYNWEEAGSVTIDDAIDAASDMVREFSPMYGTVFAVAWAEIPDTFLLCDGSTYNRVDYPSLYAVLDAAFIDDADTFHVPDLLNRVPVGAGGDFDVGDTGGSQTHTLTWGEMPVHSHSYVPPVINIDVEAPGVPDPVAAGIGIPVQTGNAGNNEPHQNMQPYIALKWVIWAR